MLASLPAPSDKPAEEQRVEELRVEELRALLRFNLEVLRRPIDGAEMIELREIALTTLQLPRRKRRP